MKKIITIILLLFAANLYAQWEPQKGKESTSNSYTRMKSGDTVAQMVYLNGLNYVYNHQSVDTLASVTTSWTSLQSITGDSVSIYSFYVQNQDASNDLYISTDSTNYIVVPSSNQDFVDLIGKFKATYDIYMKSSSDSVSVFIDYSK